MNQAGPPTPPGPGRPPSTEPDGATELVRTLREELRSLIDRQRKGTYKSESNVDSIPTGHRYQALALGEDRVGGFRSAREEVLAAVRFDGRSVLDVGCNTGELCRIARKLGAALVDGFDYDPYWIALGQLVNAYNGTTRVSLYTADATDAQAYRGTYDIVLAFSVFPYITKALPALAAATGKMLLLETHLLSRPGAKQRYLDTLRPYFAAHRDVGGTDWGAALDGEREVLAFARDEASLDELLWPGGRPPTADAGERADPMATLPRAGYVDVERSRCAFLDPFEREFRIAAVHELPALLDRIEQIDLSSFPAGDRLAVASGVSYWVAFLKGYAEYVRDGTVDPSGLFPRYVASLFRDREFDAAFKPIVEDPARLAGRIRRRYEALDMLRTGRIDGVPPVTLINPAVRREGFRLIDDATGSSLSCELFDGYHRLFCARLCRVPRLRYECELRTP